MTYYWSAFVSKALSCTVYELFGVECRDLEINRVGQKTGLHVSAILNILCLICINRQYPQNCIEFDNEARVLLNFHSKYSKIRTISNTWLVQTKFNMSDQRVRCLPSDC